MEEQNKMNSAVPKGNSRLFFRTYVSFAVVIMVFAITLSVLYMRMYSTKTMRDDSADLISEAKSIASKCTTFFLDGDYDGWSEYAEQLNDILLTVDLCLVSNRNARMPMYENFCTVSNLDALEFLENSIVDNLMSGAINTRESGFSTGFSKAHDSKMLTVAVPVMGRDMEVAAVLFLFSPYEKEQEIVISTLRIMLVSSILALIIVFVVAIPFARALSMPISKIRSNALTLASGDYSAKTHIVRNDEVGELAEAMDFLADKLAQNEIERKNAEQMRLDFFANVSHELRTPITVVRAYTEMLNDGIVSDPEEIKQYYSRMNNECIAMERLVGDLLTLSKMQNPDFEVEKEPVNLQQVFADLERTAGTIAEEKGIKICMDMCQDPCIMMGDYGRLRQMFLVILDNAIKFSNEGGNIYVTLRCDDSIVASIRDEGVGMSEDEIPNIFDKFYKSKLRQNAKGSGLGLSIAKHICLKHGGEIKVESKKGAGTCFTFIFEPETKVRVKKNR